MKRSCTRLWQAFGSVFLPLILLGVCHAAGQGAPAPNRASRHGTAPLPRLEATSASGNDEDGRRPVRQQSGAIENSEAGLLFLARAQMNAGRYDRAERSALEAVRVRPSFDGFLLMAELAMRREQLNRSVEWLERAAALRPRAVAVYRLLGMDYALGGMRDQAIASFEYAIQLQPGDWELRYLLGRALAERNDLQAARKAFGRAAELNGSPVKVRTAIGQVEEKLHLLDQAEQSYRAALRQCAPAGTECAWPSFQLGVLTAQLHGAEDSLPYLRQTVALRPNWAKAHFYLGKTLAAAGDTKGALAEVETAARLDTNKPDYHYQLAQLHRRLGNASKADEHLLRFRTLSAQKQTDTKAGVDEGN